MAARTRFIARVSDGTYQWEVVPRCLCGSDGGHQIAAADRFGIPATSILCVRCGVVRRSPRLAAASLPQFYEDDYHALHMGLVTAGPETSLVRQGQGAQIYRLIAPYLPDRDLHVTEVGAGNGGVLREFATAAVTDGRTVTLLGCELAEDYVSVGQALGTPLLHGGTETLDGSPACDVLILSHVLEHFPDPHAELMRLAPLLKPQGLVYVEVPGLLAIHEKPQYNFRLQHHLTVAHTYDFTLSSLGSVLGRAGFQCVAGDQEVRSIFRAGGKPLEDDPAEAGRILGYIKWLERSPRLALRRARLQSSHRFRAALRRVVIALLGQERARALKQRLSRTTP